MKNIHKKVLERLRAKKQVHQEMIEYHIEKANEYSIMIRELNK